MKPFTLFLTLLFFSATLYSQSLPEYTLKAAYLYNFALLSDWPESKKSSQTFNLCFFQNDLDEASDALNNKSIHDKILKTLIVSTPQEAVDCQMIFIREQEIQKSKKLIHALSNQAILIVAESPDIQDSHITIFKENQKLAFNINLQRLKKTSLVLSSHLLKLAKRVNQ